MWNLKGVELGWESGICSGSNGCNSSGVVDKNRGVGEKEEGRSVMSNVEKCEVAGLDKSRCFKASKRQVLILVPYWGYGERWWRFSLVKVGFVSEVHIVFVRCIFIPRRFKNGPLPHLVQWMS